MCAVVELVRIGTTSMTFSFEVWGEEFRSRPRTRAARGRYVTAHIARDHHCGAASTPWPQEWVTALSRSARSQDARPAYSLE